MLFFVLFVALGTWQVQRRTWKLDLIARVEQRVHAPATPAPALAQWSTVTAATDEYRHVTATGTFLDAAQTLVQAVTDLGAGYWVLTPLQAADGTIVLVNRGFIPADDRNRVQPAAAPSWSSAAPSTPGSPAAARDSPTVTSLRGSPVAAPDPASAVASSAGPTQLVTASTITGLLRMTEPSGAFLRRNNPATNQWYSRDVQAIAAAHGLTHVAPYFIDLERPAHDVVGLEPHSTVRPVPGLTVIHFHNSHLVYAITWYTLALMTAIAIPLGLRKP